MNTIAKNKIEIISNHLHEFARKTCPKYINVNPCEDCDIVCPFDQIDDLLSSIKREEVDNNG